MTDQSFDIGDDLLRGAEEIALFMFKDRKFRRSIYHLAATSRFFPCFRIGSMICCRKSTLQKWIEDQERR